ncbi:MAG: class I SAM-dependent methyltransferase [Caldilineales bacterium]
MGRWSRLVASAFLRWLSPASGLRWLDVGCGTGALSEAILAHAAPAAVLAVDPSDAFIAYASHRLADTRVICRVGDALNLPDDAQAMQVAASGLALNFFPEPVAALRSMRRAVQPDGIVALYVWDYADGMEMLRYFWDSAAALDPRARTLDEGVRFPICRPDALRQVCVEAELHHVEVAGIEVSQTFTDFADFWMPFLGGQGPAPAYVAGLSQAGRLALEDHLRANLSVQTDGSLHLVARAWAVRAVA